MTLSSPAPDTQPVKGSWLADVLLESPIPPGNYLPTRRERLGIARAMLRGGARPNRLVDSHRLRDLGSAHPLIGATRIVPGEQIAAELEADMRSVNPPVIQGWMLGLLVLGSFPVLRASPGSPLRETPATSPVRSRSSYCRWSRSSPSSRLRRRGSRPSLNRDNVRVRTWLEARLHRLGRDLGAAKGVDARLEPAWLVLAGPLGSARLSLRWWPPSALRDAIDELPIWGRSSAVRRAPPERDLRREQLRRRQAARTRAHRRRHHP
jgi:hypothetical protein